MTYAYKVLKNKNHKVLPLVEIPTAQSKEVSFIMTAKGVLGFRESAHIIKIAEETNCTVSIAAGKKFGNNKSILSLINLGILPGKSLVLNIKGERNEEVFREISKIIAGTTDSNS